MTSSILSSLLSSPLMAQTALQPQNQSALTQRAAAVAFRVDTDIYVKGNDPKPDKQTLTLFKEGVYYDFPMDDEKQTITMTDPLGGRIVVLSPYRKIKTAFNTAELASRIESLMRDIGANKDLAKMLQPTVTEEKNGVLRVGDASFAYQATLQPARDPSIAQQYKDFADWSARLNALLPPNFPPFVRLQLNQEIAERAALPDTIERITTHNGRTTTIRSKVLVIAGLSSDDEAKIRMVGELLSRCTEVSQAEFYSNPAEIARNGAPRSPTK